MTSLEELLSKRVGPLETTFALSSVMDPDTNQPVTLRFRVPTSVDVANMMTGDDAPLATSAAIVAKFMIEPRLSAVVLQDACTTEKGAFVEPAAVVARIFTADEIIAITNHLFEVARITSPAAEIEETAKN